MNESPIEKALGKAAESILKFDTKYSGDPETQRTKEKLDKAGDTLKKFVNNFNQIVEVSDAEVFEAIQVVLMPYSIIDSNQKLSEGLALNNIPMEDVVRVEENRWKIKNKETFLKITEHLKSERRKLKREGE